MSCPKLILGDERKQRSQSQVQCCAESLRESPRRGGPAAELSEERLPALVGQKARHGDVRVEEATRWIRAWDDHEGRAGHYEETRKKVPVYFSAPPNWEQMERRKKERRKARLQWTAFVSQKYFTFQTLQDEDCFLPRVHLVSTCSDQWLYTRIQRLLFQKQQQQGNTAAKHPSPWRIFQEWSQPISDIIGRSVLRNTAEERAEITRRMMEFS